MYNIQKAVSRLDYAPKLKDIRITNIKRGLAVFAPQPARAVSFAALRETLKKAGYALDSAEITVAGVVARDADGWWLVAEPTGQRFALAGADVEKTLAGSTDGARVELTGDWETTGAGDAARETITPRALGKSVGAPGAPPDGGAPASPREGPAVTFASAGFDGSRQSWLGVPLAAALPPESSTTLAPIRATSPGLTVFKGGAVVPRLFLVEQHLGGLSVSRQIFQLGVSYTPSPRVQLEVEVPVSRTSFEEGARGGDSAGLGNVTLWGKYRFYRTLKTYGDRQAAARVGLELPTGKKAAPSAREVDAPAFVRQQLTPISGGLAPHLDLAFSQAGGRFIFGGDAEGVLRTARDGFRTGHELRVNTDLEYVLLPFKYESPGHELFLVLESSFVHRAAGRLGGLAVPGSKATEYYIEPGLQYAADPRFVVEGSVQFPLVRNTGALALRTDRNILVGVRYLF